MQFETVRVMPTFGTSQNKTATIRKMIYIT